MTELEALEQELLNQMADEPEMYVQTEEFCTIDPDARTITVPVIKRILGVESDELAERLYFRCPRIVGDNIDLSQLAIRINFENANKDQDQYLVTDVKVDGEDITFSWLISRKVTKYKGKIKFIVCAVKTAGGDILNEWNTTLNTDCETLEGLEVSQAGVEEETRDVVQQLIELMSASAKQAVKDVQTEGEKQVKVVQEAAQEIAADREQIQTNKTGIADLLQNKADAIVSEAAGEAISVRDSSAHFLKGLNVYGKSEQVTTKGYQLFDASKIPSITKNGVTIKNNGDGSFTFQGSISDISGGSVYRIHRYNHEETSEILKPGFLKCSLKDGKSPYAFFSIKRNTTNDIIAEINTLSANSIEIKQEYLDNPDVVINVGIYINSNFVLTPRTIKPMFYIDGDGTWEPFTGGKPSPSPDYPQEIGCVGDDGKILTGFHGCQLFDASKIPSITKNGVTIKNNGDGSFTFQGSISDISGGSVYRIHRYNHEETSEILKPGFLKCSLKDGKSPYAFASLVYSKTNESIAEINTILNKQIEIKQEYLDNPDVMLKIGVFQNANEELTPRTIKPMFYIDGDGTWEPFQTLQSLTLPTPNGLPGISVTSGGNYTDETGQQWICDEIDLARGKYVQRIYKNEFNGEEEWRLNSNTALGCRYMFEIPLSVKKSDNNNIGAFSMNTSFQLGDSEKTYFLPNLYTINLNKLYVSLNGTESLEEFKQYLNKNPMTVLCALNTPIETDLDPETIKAYKELHTNYPSTVVTNDSGANMKLTYVADTGNYILGKFKELEQTVVNTQAHLLERM